MTNNQHYTVPAAAAYLFYLLTCVGAVNGLANLSSAHQSFAYRIETGQVVLNSHSFTTQKRSSFSLGKTTEQTNRGLTIIHFTTSTTCEFRTFDTYASKEAAAEFIDVLKRMQENNSVFAIVAHDSAAKSLRAQTAILSDMGFLKLAALQRRQAYLMHNFEGGLYEVIDDLSISETLPVPTNISDANIYFPKIKYDFKPNNNRYIAHAGGEVNGITLTNTKDALDQNYAKGFRFFELDILQTSDGKWVAAHEWEMWARFTDYTGALPPSHSAFKKHTIYGEFSTMDIEDINTWFAAHPDASLVTDKVKEPIAFADAFVDKNRLYMELFSLMAVEKALQNDINVIISQKPLMAIKGDKLNYLEVNNIKYVAVSRRIIDSQTDLLLQLRDHGIKVYVYNVNFDAGKDERYVEKHELGLVYGMYADKWVFDTFAEPSK